MAARRCHNCDLNWPDYSSYKECPRCDGATVSMSTVEHMTAEEIKRTKATIEFDKSYPEDSKRWAFEPRPDLCCCHEPERICWYHEDIPKRLGEGELTIHGRFLRFRAVNRKRPRVWKLS